MLHKKAGSNGRDDSRNDDDDVGDDSVDMKGV